MGEGIWLHGAEDVKTASHRISNAAEAMTRAVAEFGEHVVMLKRALEDHALALREFEEARRGEWQPIETAPKMRKLVVFYRNSLGKGRCVLACYYKKNALEMADDYADVGEYDDETGISYAEAGWYEEHEQDSPLMPLAGTPTHWMPLPAGGRIVGGIPLGHEFVPHTNGPERECTLYQRCHFIDQKGLCEELRSAHSPQPASACEAHGTSGLTADAVRRDDAPEVSR